ncbi:cob(I)yrinic acid a,c-diamide adenosyltransferase [Mucilaginibacter robiniae]|uniref:Corrinoid adenosyltransferase n=1 Tax=Mucilaginibacter robiniae TaxID=2728022 RepID=A0A7L5E284_9SPHI|nr:cob(I)yrinic acid a,c-diamide adenosyltransferase [Mucilaginibacter robiniae]QJD94466.1 cob(I)yrinic acid a,c-diamide adenosyltransferase [Mucilaginibacter robiniae]
MKIYTKTGDQGFTSLLGGSRVPKYHLRIESYGTVDELNAYIGLIADQPTGITHQAALQQIQDRLFVIGAMLAADPEKPAPKIPDLQEVDVHWLEQQIDEMNEQLPPLQHFILPGGNTIISFCHVARCVCRRAERGIVQLAEDSFVDNKVIMYLNRLSDYLFVLARKIGHEQQIPEKKWVPGT